MDLLITDLMTDPERTMALLSDVQGQLFRSSLTGTALGTVVSHRLQSPLVVSQGETICPITLSSAGQSYFFASGILQPAS